MTTVAAAVNQERLTDVMLRIAANQERDFRWRSLRSLLLPYLGPGDLLDAGCGSGHLSLEALRRGAQVTAVDLSPEMLDVTRRTCAAYTGHLQVRQLDMASIGLLEPARFDCILSVDVLEHVKDDMSAARHLARLLKPNGVMVILVPAMPSLYGPRDHAEGHYRRYSRHRLRHMLTQAELHVTRLRYWNATSLPLVLLFEKLLRRNMYDDGTRYLSGSLWKRLANELLAGLLGAERHVALPAGLSLLATGVRTGEQG